MKMDDIKKFQEGRLTFRIIQTWKPRSRLLKACTIASIGQRESKRLQAWFHAFAHHPSHDVSYIKPIEVRFGSLVASALFTHP